MIGLLVVPILICGYITITTLPKERIRISLYQGWSLYLRAATYGTLIVATVFFIFCITLPSLPLKYPEIEIFRKIPSQSAVNLLASYILKNSNLTFNIDAKSILTLQIISLSTISICSTAFLSITLKVLALLFPRVYRKNQQTIVNKLVQQKSPIEYSLLIIAEKLSQDILYNQRMSNLRNMVLAMIEKDIIKKSDPEFNDILEEVELRDPDKFSYALITLDNGKFYIGCPKIIPIPDEESISSNSISFLPIISGFRDEKQNLVFTTRYDFDIELDRDIDCISIPRSNIISVSSFNFETYYRLKNNSLHSKLTRQQSLTF